jgi:hypothetical protein
VYHCSPEEEEEEERKRVGAKGGRVGAKALKT